MFIFWLFYSTVQGYLMASDNLGWAEWDCGSTVEGQQSTSHQQKITLLNLT